MGKVYLGNQEISPAVSVPVAKEKFGATVDTFIGDVNENGVLSGPTKQTSVVFDGVKEIGNSACSYIFYDKTNIIDATFPELTMISGSSACDDMFNNCSNLTSVSFPKLTMINGSYACNYMFKGCSNLTSVSFPELTTISNSNACTYMFNNCSNLTSVSFPKLTTISGNRVCSNMFNNCSNLTSVSFPELTTISESYACNYMFKGCSLTSVSFPKLVEILPANITNQFKSMFSNCSALTEIHFPAAMQARIEQLDEYADKFGATNATIYFDL